MGKKIAAILLALVLVGASGAGVYIWSSTKSDKDKNTATVSTTVTATVNTTGTQKPTGNTAASSNTDASLESDTQQEPEDNTETVETTNLTVLRVVDTTSDSEVTAREVLGEEYGSSYIKLNSDRTFRINLGYKGKSGTYKKDSINNTISVVYDDDSTDKFTYSTDDSGNIAYLIVPYGDYEIYFG